MIQNKQACPVFRFCAAKSDVFEQAADLNQAFAVSLVDFHPDAIVFIAPGS